MTTQGSLVQTDDLQYCTRCIYHARIPDITFDEEGVCRYCRMTEQLDKEYATGEEGMKILDEQIAQMKKDGKGKKYDVVIGVSGGCDSSFMLHFAKEKGLRPLAAHFDNTWNSKIAVENIQTMLEQLDIDLFTHVVDNKEYCDIFKSFFKASVPEVDTPSDIALATTHYLACEKFGVKYIWEGHSFRTEGISPPGWFYMDAKYIESVQNTFGNQKIRTLPNLWMHKWLKWMIINRIKKFRPLYYLDYDKEKTKKFLEEKYGWQWYGGHHMENRTAYFTNNYYLPRKFNIDLRYSEFSALIRAGQMTREEALEKIKQPKEVDPTLLEEVKKRLNFTDKEFEDVMNQPGRTFMDFRTYKQTFERHRWFFWILYRLGFVPKSFYMKYTKKYDKEALEAAIMKEAKVE